MAVVVHVFDTPVYVDDVAYRAQVAGRQVGRLWEGWIEFLALDGSDVRRTPRETTQPDWEALVYWAGGLSGTYLEGAMARALHPAPKPVLRTRPPAAVFEAPAPREPVPSAAPVDVARAPSPHVERPVLDPFSVAQRGQLFLRRELQALRGWHLRAIVRAYNLSGAEVDIDAMSAPELVELIAAAVEARGARA